MGKNTKESYGKKRKREIGKRKKSRMRKGKKAKGKNIEKRKEYKKLFIKERERNKRLRTKKIRND